VQFDGEFVVDGTPSEVWPYFNDPEILADCAPGCERIELLSPSRLGATMEVGIGSVQPSFDVEAVVVDCQEPERLELRASGEASRNSFEVTAWQELADNGDGTTTVTWSADATVSGFIASVGERAIESVTTRLVTEFFDDIETHVREGTPAEAKLAAAEEADEPVEPSLEPAAPESDSRPLYAAAGIAGVVAVLLWLRRRDNADEGSPEDDTAASEPDAESADSSGGDGSLRYVALGAVLGVAGKLLWDRYASSGPPDSSSVRSESGLRTAGEDSPTDRGADGSAPVGDAESGGVGSSETVADDVEATEGGSADTDDGATGSDENAGEGMIEDPLDRLD
jgi:carbon monoxide dehydrogenase subunit G